MPASDYRKLENLGEGTFGVVTKAEKSDTGEIYAIKKIRGRASKTGQDQPTLREIMLLQELRHEHVIELIEVLTYEGGGISLVFEYCVTDLEVLIKDRSACTLNPRPRPADRHAAAVE